jgi:hypothetical protein
MGGTTLAANDKLTDPTPVRNENNNAAMKSAAKVRFLFTSTNGPRLNFHLMLSEKPVNQKLKMKKQDSEWKSGTNLAINEQLIIVKRSDEAEENIEELRAMCWVSKIDYYAIYRYFAVFDKRLAKSCFRQLFLQVGFSFFYDSCSFKI